MNCPVCRKEVLIALEFECVEVDYCVACGGVWLDEGEIDLLFGDEKACTEFLSIGKPAPDHNEKARPCPACDKAMTKESTEGEAPVIFDACPQGHGLWFDHGELDTILAQAAEKGMRGPVDTLLLGLFTDQLPQATETVINGESAKKTVPKENDKHVL